MIAEDTYFTPWESTFQVQASKKVTVEVKSQEKSRIVNESKMVASNVKNTITIEEERHITNLLKLFLKEDINIKNLHLKKDKLNKIIAVYEKRRPIAENHKPKIISGVVDKLAKKK